MNSKWNPDSWRAHDAQQMPEYRDGDALDRATQTLSTYHRSFLPVKRVT